MRVMLYLAVHELRIRWRGWAAFVLLVAVAGGAVLAAAAGARRTSTAYPRFLRVSHASDLLVSPAGTGTTGYDVALARLPGVKLAAPVVGLGLIPVRRDGRLDLTAGVLAPADDQFGRVTDVPKVLAGRLPRSSHAAEIAVSQIAAARYRLHVGSVLDMEALPDNGPPAPGVPKGPPARPHRLIEHVVGIIVTRASADPVTELDKVPFIQASQAMWHQLGPRYLAFDGAYVMLRRGATVNQVSHEAQALARHFPATGGQVYVADESTQAAAVEQAIHPEAVALAIFALVLACTALVVVGQVAARLVLQAGADNPVLAALGTTRGQLTAAGLAEVAVAGSAGAVLAAGVAVAVSPLTPIGIARLAEPSPGVSADWLVLATGAAAIVLLLTVRASWPAWRVASARVTGRAVAARGPGRRSWLAGGLAGTGAPVTMVAGVRLAVEPGRGRTAVPARAALAGATLSVLAVTAALTFGANLTSLVHTPRLYGQAWDAGIDLQFQVISPRQAEQRFGTNPGVTGWTYGDHGIIGIGGQLVPAIGLAPGRGPMFSPTLLAGRAPGTSHEIVLGTSTLRRLGLHVGQPVAVTVNGHPMRDRIVGRAVFPNFGQGSFTPTDLGDGAETTAAVLRSQAVPTGGLPGYEFVLLRFTHGPGRGPAMARFQRSMGRFCAQVQQSTCVVMDQRPNGVTSYARIDGTPRVLAALLAALGIAVLAQFVVVSGRRRRRDFAVLKTLGLLGRQLRAVIAWQVSVLAGIALLVGLPLGVAVGRWSWQLFGSGLGIPPGAGLPVSLVLLTLPAVLIIANAVALWPGRSAARIRPAQVLRTE